MLKFLKSPLVRMSFGMVMITISMLLLSDLLGMVPDERRANFKSRKVIAESLAVQFSIQIAENRLSTVEEILRVVVQRNEDVLSAGVRQDHEGLVAEFGGHSARWSIQPGEPSTATQIQVPLFQEHGPWGTVELTFTSLDKSGDAFVWHNSFPAVIGLVGVSCFFGYLLFLKRTLRELDPSAVIPDRVRLALDTLAEGLLIVDQLGVIVFANQVFAHKTGLTSDDLVGKKSSSLTWEMADESSDCGQLPWVCLLEGRELPDTNVIRLNVGLNTSYTFAVNTSKISSEEGKTRGALITFDDITETEKRNEELQRTLGKLEQSQLEITRQNQELHVLATRDSLTNLLNRRSFFQSFEIQFAEALEETEDLACIMADIDHFKSVNDRFGHSVGDKVIKLLAKALTDCTRSNDLVCRFGGEEFCIVLPEAGRDSAAAIAERIRLAFQENRIEELADGESITASFGVSDVSLGSADVAELVDQADQALYTAKERGRNQVFVWSGDTADEASPVISENSSPEEVSTLNQEESQPPTATNPQESRQLRQAKPIETVVKDEQKRTIESPVREQTDNPVARFTAKSTRLSNRSLLFDRIDQAILRSQRYQTQIAVLVINFDALQRVNETMGFSVGEKFAKTVTSRLKEMLRNTDTVSLMQEKKLLFSVSRPGGDEFVVLLTDLKQSDVVPSIMKRLFTAMNAPIQVGSTEVYLDADIGVSLYPLDSEDADSLLSRSNSALREAKKLAGRNNFQFYSADINRRSKQQLRLEADLHRALERGELIVYYQPKVDLKTGTILGMEALLRWQHPQIGMIPPNDFIPLAEHSGLIGRISQQVIRTACQQILTWQDAGYGTLSIAVNLSPVEFRTAELAEQIINVVEETGIPANSLEIEITETVVMQNMATAIDTLTRLNDAGLPISLDDFGTGYSSFSYLKKFPLSKIKIDRSFISNFVQNSNDAALVSAIIALGHSLGLIVVAEGVETDDQLRFLQDMHCDEMQGYIVSKPLPIDGVSELLSRSVSIKNMITNHGTRTTRQDVAGLSGILNEFSAPAMKHSEEALNSTSTLAQPESSSDRSRQASSPG